MVARHHFAVTWSKVRPDGTRVKINFYVYFEIDDDEVKALLRGTTATKRGRGCCSSQCRQGWKRRWRVSASGRAVRLSQFLKIS